MSSTLPPISQDNPDTVAQHPQEITSLLGETRCVSRSESALSYSSTLCDEFLPSSQARVQSNGQRLLEFVDIEYSSPDRLTGVIPTPIELNDTATERMAWIMQMVMDMLLPLLSTEDRAVIEGKQDLAGLIVPLFQSWEEFRTADKSAKKTRNTAREMYQKLKANFRKNEVFDSFWSRKLADEQDEVRWGGFKKAVRSMIEHMNLIDRVLSGTNMGNVFSPAQAIVGVVYLFINAARKTFDAYELMAETFDKMYLFVRNLHDSLNAHLITSTMLETYVFVVIDIFKITILATQYVKRGNKFYWKAMFDPQDELYSLTRRFEQHGGRQILSQVSQISLLLQRYNNKVSVAIDGISQQMGLIYRETVETSRHMSAMAKKLNTDPVTTTSKSIQEEMEDLKRWLKVPPDTEDDFTKFKSQKMPGTCEWIFDNEKFQRWKTSEDRQSALLWIFARATRGKSVLATRIIQQLQVSTRDTPDACVYFFCRSDDEAKKSPHSILRSTAYWLAQRNDTIRQRLTELVSKDRELRIEELPLASLWDRLFMNCICHPSPAEVAPFRIYWVIDALDECEPSLRGKFTKMLAELGEDHCGVSFKVLFLSRFVPDISKVVEMAAIPTFDMTISDNDRDIQQYIEVNIRSCSLGRLNEDDRHQIINALKMRANGSFLWAKLVMEELAGRRSMRSVQSALNEIRANESLEDIYQLVLDSLAGNLDPEDLDIAREIFLWTLCSPRPLTIDELTAALEASMDTTMMDMERTIKETCGSLIEVVESQTNASKQVMAAHITLREFMQSEKAIGSFAFTKAEAHAHIAKVCLTYLLRPKFGKPITAERDKRMDPEVLGAKHRFWNYASRFWSFHLVADLESFDPELHNLLLLFLQSRNVLTSIEAIATFGNLGALTRHSDNLRIWQSFVPVPKEETKRWICLLPIDEKKESSAPDDVVARWSLDFRRIKQRFQHTLVRYPRTIHDSLPAFCPLKSMIYQIGASHTEVSIANPTCQIREWDRRLSMFQMPGFVRTMVCSPQQPYIASAVDSPVITLWHAETGTAIRPFIGHTDQVYILAFSKDEKCLVSAGKDETVIVWNVERGHEIFRLRGHMGAIHSLAYSQSGEQIASGGSDGLICIWSISDESGQLEYALPGGHIGVIYTLKYHTDNVHLCSSGDDGRIVVWNAAHGMKLHHFDANLKWMGRLSYHPSLPHILSASEKEPNIIDIWDTNTGKLVNRIPTKSSVRCWKYTPNGEYIVSAHLDGKVRVWDSRTGARVHTIIEDAWSLKFSNKGKYLVCLIRYISRWQVRTWHFEEEMRKALQRKCGNQKTEEQENRLVFAVTVSNDNSRVATVSVPYAGTWYGTMKLWNPVTAEIIWQQEQRFRSHECVSPGFSPDSKYLAFYDGKEDGGIHLIDAASAELVELIPVPTRVKLMSLAVDVDGRSLAVAMREDEFFEDGEFSEDGNDPRFILARRDNGVDRPVNVVMAYRTHNSIALSFTADGSKLLLAARALNDTLWIVVWDLATCTIIRTVVYNDERYIWFKMFGGFRFQGEDRIIVHLDYMRRDAIRRSLWWERMLVLSDGNEVERFEAGSSRMTIAGDRIIFLDSDYWIVSWDGQGQPKRHVQLPYDVGFAVSGLSFCDGKLTLISRMEGITVVTIDSLR